ncbi:MAG TPA: HepT-like ribonuclease domain-containing protein [Pseudobdellovibrionaceae bacterium]|jgi:uncharacterized protein YutE (UPF0331/DUF86 family)
MESSSMTEDQEILKESLEELRQAKQWLHHSYSLCKALQINMNMEIESFDKLEALTSRFARLVDLLVNKTFRTIDTLELEYGGSLIDVVNRAAKRGIVDSVEQVREFKDLRNEIAHEYAKRDLTRIFKNVVQLTPSVLDLCEKTEQYCLKWK